MSHDVPASLHLFEGYGVELEYMIVDRETLNVFPLAEELIDHVAGKGASEWNPPVGPVAWSNELAMHVIEIKSNGPSPSLYGLAKSFQEHVNKITDLLEAHSATLLSSGMHPWMDPLTQTILWPHEQNNIYLAYDRIFGCRGHGWSNLQSNHINLSFHGDDEFMRLHAAVRAVLPLIPALAASSPAVDGVLTGIADTRLEVYRKNQPGVRLAIGDVIPEDVGSIPEYHERVLRPMYEEIAPLDPDGVLQQEWLNSHGAIARFERMAIEIRLVDIQESPLADIALTALISETVRALTEERWGSIETLRSLKTKSLADLLFRTIVTAENTPVSEPALLNLLGWNVDRIPRAGELWSHLAEQLIDPDTARQEGWQQFYDLYREAGTLSSRVSLAASRDGKIELQRVYHKIAHALQEGGLFRDGS
ncbi:MAG: glutamate-cysteine ligase family protein [bacterium]